MQKIIWDIPDEQVYVLQWQAFFNWPIFDLEYIHMYSATDTNS